MSEDERAMYAPPDAQYDIWLYRMVIGGLGLTVLLTVILAAVLAFRGLALPDGIIAIGGTAAGGLVGLLIPSPVG